MNFGLFTSLAAHLDRSVLELIYNLHSTDEAVDGVNFTSPWTVHLFVYQSKRGRTCPVSTDFCRSLWPTGARPGPCRFIHKSAGMRRTYPVSDDFHLLL